MALRGTISYFPTRKPTPREYNECRHLQLTAETPDWNPHSRRFNENENAMTDEDGYMKHPSRRRTIMKAKTDSNSLLDALEMSESMSLVSCALSDISNTLNDRLFINAIRSKVEVTYDDYIESNSTTNKTKTKSAQSTMKIANTKSKTKYKLTCSQIRYLLGATMEDKYTQTLPIGSRFIQHHPKAIVTRHLTFSHIEKAFQIGLYLIRQEKRPSGKCARRFVRQQVSTRVRTI